MCQTHCRLNDCLWIRYLRNSCQSYFAHFKQWLTNVLSSTYARPMTMPPKTSLTVSNNQLTFPKHKKTFQAKKRTLELSCWTQATPISQSSITGEKISIITRTKRNKRFFHTDVIRLLPFYWMPSVQFYQIQIQFYQKRRLSHAWSVVNGSSMGTSTP